MSTRLREAWTSLVKAEDYEAHMAEAGQAQANANLVVEYFRSQPTERGAPLLFVGAGTGQMFDFAPPSFLLPFQTTFTDINPEYLQRLAARLRGVEGLRHTEVVDDIEESRLTGGFQVVLGVLVLEHVAWRRAVATMCRLAVERALVVIQENPPTLTTAITLHRTIVGTMNVFRDCGPVLVPRPEVEAEFGRQGFAPNYFAERLVADDKRMLALGFERRSPSP
jgi:2-polyprenyl-3-methyl-5-hydroxy-6-metoxy-1,4-benzoquinol methylase